MTKSMALCDVCKQFYRQRISCTLNDKRKHHSYNDEPSIVWKVGTKHWHRDGMLHRIDGPAIIFKNYSDWYYNGEYIIKTTEEIIIGKPVDIDKNVATVLKHVKGVFYEVLLGDKKVLVAKV